MAEESRGAGERGGRENAGERGGRGRRRSSGGESQTPEMSQEKRRPQRRRRNEEGRAPREKEFTETTIGSFRHSATVKGGRRLSFGALVCVGDKKGRVGIGYGKAKEVPGAVQKALKKGRKNLISFPIAEGGTIPHPIEGRFGATRVVLVPAMPGTGVIAGTTVKAILEAGGVTNILTKIHGSTKSINTVKAVLNALENLRSKKMVEELRGVPL